VPRILLATFPNRGKQPDDQPPHNIEQPNDRTDRLSRFRAGRKLNRIQHVPILRANYPSGGIHVDQLRTLMQRGDNFESACGNEPEQEVFEMAQGSVIAPLPVEYLSVHVPVSPATIPTAPGKETSDALAALIAKLVEEQRVCRGVLDLPEEMDTSEPRQLNDTQKRDRQRHLDAMHERTSL